MNRLELFTAVVLGLLVVACGGASQSPVVTGSPVPTATGQLAGVTVEGSVGGSDLVFTALAPAGWQSFGFGARRGSEYGSGAAFFVSVVYNTFQDPCLRTQRTPRIGTTVDDVVSALGEIPHTTASAPEETTIAGHSAAYIEVQIPSPPPCGAGRFYMWQDSPEIDTEYWVLKPSELFRIWLIEEQGYVIALAARSSPATTEELKAEAVDALNSMVFAQN